MDSIASKDFAKRLRDLSPNVKQGSDLVGAYEIDAAPQLVIDPITGYSMTVQVVPSDAVEMSEAGQYARNELEIIAAVWDDAAQSWLPGEALTVDAVADTKPAVFADEDRAYVVWIKDNGTGTDLMYSTNDGSGWTPAAVLLTNGLAPGGTFTSVAMGREATGRVNVLFNYRVQNADRSLDSKLYNRASTGATFDQPAGVEVIAADTNFSGLATTNRPDGALVASWKSGDGVTNEIFSSTLAADAMAWSEPMQLTQGDTIEQRPSVAIEPDGRQQVLFEIVETGEGDAAAVDGAPMEEGVGGSTAEFLPEVGFTRSLDIDEEEFAILGGTATGRATIINRGTTTTDVTIAFLQGPPQEGPNVLGSRVVRLAPGATFEASFDFAIVSGEVEYSMRLTADSPELVGGDDNYSTYTLNGLPDLELVSFGLQNPSASAGPGNPFVARVRNRSGVAIGEFDVDFRSGDELFPQNPWSSFATLSVPSLAAGAETLVTTPSTAASTAGLYTFSAYIDAAGAIAEASEANNRRAFAINHQSDPGLLPTGIPQIRVGATLLDSSGVNNVRVTANVFNFASGSNASIASGPVTVRLLRSIDGGDSLRSIARFSPRSRLACRRPCSSRPAGWQVTTSSGSSSIRNPPPRIRI